MKSQNDIFTLIKSLTGPEKRYFKLYAGRNSVKGKNNYVLLFDLVDKQKKHDEKLLREKVKKLKKYLSYSETKYQLQNVILKSLIAFHSDSHAGMRINQLRNRIIVLISKSMHNQSIELIEKLKKEAMVTGNFALVIDLISYERELAYFDFSYSVLDKNLQKWYDEQQQATLLLQNLNEYLHTHAKLMHVFFRIGTARNQDEYNQVNALIELPVLQNESRALTPWSKFWFHYSHKIHAWVTRDYDKLLFHCNKVIAIFNEHPELKKAHYIHFLQALEHKSRTLVHMHFEKESAEAFNMLKSEIQKNRKWISIETYKQWFNSKCETELWYHLVFAKFSEGVKCIQQMESELKQLNKQTGRDRSLPSPFCIACIYFGNMQYKKALPWLNKIIQQSPAKERMDFQVLSRLLLLLCLFELNDMDYFSSMWRSVYRFLLKQKRMHKLESLLLDYMKRSASYTTKAQFKKMYIDIKKEVNRIKNDPFEKTFLEYFNFEAWLNSKIENISYEEAVRNLLKTKPA